MAQHPYSHALWRTSVRQKVCLGVWCHQAGATLIEFALVFPVLLMVIMGAFEFFFVLFLRGGVETSLHETARSAMTGSLYGEEGSREEVLLADIKNRLELVLFGDSDYEIKTEVYDTFQSVSGGGGLTLANPGFGGSSQIVRYTVRYVYDYQTPLAALIDGLGEDTVITSSVFVRNEDF